jgi:hypothetical protein
MQIARQEGGYKVVKKEGKKERKRSVKKEKT